MRVMGNVISSCNFLIGGWWGNQMRSQRLITLSILRLQPVRGYMLMVIILQLAGVWFLSNNWEMCIRLYFWDKTKNPWGWFIILSYSYFSAWLPFIFISTFLSFSNHPTWACFFLSLIMEGLEATVYFQSFS